MGLGKEQKTVIRASASLHHISPNVDFYKINQRILFGPAGNGLASFSGAGLESESRDRPSQLHYAHKLHRAGYDQLSQIRSQLIALYNTFNGKDLTYRGINFTKTVQGPQGLDAVYDLDSSRFPYWFNVDVGVQREIMRNLSVTADFVIRRSVGLEPDFRASTNSIPTAISGISSPATRLTPPPGWPHQAPALR